MLTTLEFKETRDTPEVLLDQKNNRFILSGNSFPEDSSKFYFPIFDWIQEYIKDPNKSTHLVCKFEYYNSSSAKMIYQIFIEFEKILDTGNEIKVSWYYDDEDKLIEDKGLEYDSILNIPFEMIPIK